MTTFRIDVPTQDGGRQTPEQARVEVLRRRMQEEVNRQLAALWERVRTELNTLRALHSLDPIP